MLGSAVDEGLASHCSASIREHDWRMDSFLSALPRFRGAFEIEEP